jgi:hypothetical protein
VRSSVGIVSSVAEQDGSLDLRGDGAGRKNQDFLANAKVAGWWHLRTRFQDTYRAKVDRLTGDPDDIISLASDLPGATTPDNSKRLPAAQAL